jgi:hypothetical protein
VQARPLGRTVRRLPRLRLAFLDRIQVMLDHLVESLKRTLEFSSNQNGIVGVEARENMPSGTPHRLPLGAVKELARKHLKKYCRALANNSFQCKQPHFIFDFFLYHDVFSRVKMVNSRLGITGPRRQ